MVKYLAKRILISIVILLGITVIVFFLIHLAPGNPIDAMYGNIAGITQADIDARKHAMGLDQPIVVQYLLYMKNVLKGDFGMSVQYNIPVMNLIMDRLWNTFGLMFVSLGISILLAVPIGVTSAVKQYSAFDYASTTFAFIGVSIPSFFFGFVLIRVFAVDLGWFPSAGMQTAGNAYTGLAKILDVVHHSVLPVCVLALVNLATYARYIRSSMLDVIKQEYILTAKAKGLSRRVVIYRHALRNGLIPVITVIGSNLPYLFSGSLITEIVFSWPGLGKMIYASTMARDYYVMMGVNIFIGFLVILGQFITDVLLAWVDPRIKLK